jgi:hypothetical protein
MEFIRQRLLKLVYTTVSCGILKEDKLAVAVHIAKEMHPEMFPQKVISVTFCLKLLYLASSRKLESIAKISKLGMGTVCRIKSQ